MDCEEDVIEVLPSKTRTKPQHTSYTQQTLKSFAKKRSQAKEVIEISEDEIEEIKPAPPQRASMKRKSSSVHGPDVHESRIAKVERLIPR